ncbi:DUF389 domain-containing protein [Patescibacteria group bacterium]
MNDIKLSFWGDLWSRLTKPFGLSPQDHHIAEERIEKQTKGSILFYVLLFFAVVLVTLGIIINSPAVTIGGMLIAPLYWPILGFALGVSKGAALNMYRGAVAIIISAIIAILLGYFIALLMPLSELSSEFFMRTNPTLAELFIALAAGFAGAYIRIHPKISNLISGVAIAVALLPPLAVMGISIAQASPVHFFGAFLLFLTNLFAIIFAAIIVFRIAHLTTKRLQAEAAELRTRTVVVGVFAFVLIVAVLIGLTVRATQNRNDYLAAENVISEVLPDATVLNIEIDSLNKLQRYNLTLISTTEITTDITSQIETLIEAEINKTTQVNITWIESKQISD